MSSNSLYSPLSSDDECDNIEEETAKEETEDKGLLKRRHSSKHRRRRKHKERKHRKHKHRSHGTSSEPSSRHRHHKSRHYEEEDDDDDNEIESKAQVISSKPLVQYDDISDTEDIDSQPFDDPKEVQFLVHLLNLFLFLFIYYCY